MVRSSTSSAGVSISLNAGPLAARESGEWKR